MDCLQSVLAQRQIRAVEVMSQALQGIRNEDKQEVEMFFFFRKLDIDSHFLSK